MIRRPQRPILAAALLGAGVFAAAALTPPLAAQAPPSGWTPKEPAGDQGRQTSEVAPAAALPEAEQARYDDVARALLEALDARDATAYRALFSDRGWDSAIDWWQSMFAVQYDHFGPIVKAWAPRRGTIQVGKLGVGAGEFGETMLVRFEELAGGILTFELDDDGLIRRTGVFVKEELGYAPPEGIPLLWKRPAAKKGAGGSETDEP